MRIHLWPRMANNPAEMERLRNVMARQVLVVSRLADDLMDVARYERGAIRLQRAHVNLAALIGQAIESIRPKLKARGHRLHVALDDEPIFVNGDVVRLHQVFLNILDNAVKYTDRGGTIWISAQHQGNDAEIRIRDNGPGIAASMLSTVFEMFSQASSTLDQSAGGLGIGLYLVKQLVELHGGQIEARSKGLGEGTEFVVTLSALARCEESRRIATNIMFRRIQSQRSIACPSNSGRARPGILLKSRRSSYDAALRPKSLRTAKDATTTRNLRAHSCVT